MTPMSCRIAVVTAALALSAVTWAQAQATVSPTLSSALQAHVRAERFQPVTSVRGLPLGVRGELQRLFGSTATALAEPGEPFQATDDIRDPTLPIRRMSLAACAQDHCLVYYERGGYAHSWHAVLFHWTPERTRLEAGGVAPSPLRTVDELKNALLSGALKPQGRGWN